MEIRNGDKYIQQVYQSQLKYRNQRNTESLLVFEADINWCYTKAIL